MTYPNVSHVMTISITHKISHFLVMDPHMRSMRGTYEQHRASEREREKESKRELKTGSDQIRGRESD